MAASPNEKNTQAVATTLRNRSKRIADLVTKGSAFLDWMSRKGRVKPFPGGLTMTYPLDYQENQTFIRYTGADILDTRPSTFLTMAEYSIKQAAVAVLQTGLEDLQNAGSAQHIDLMAAKIRNAVKTMKNNLAQDVYSDGTENNGKQLGGLQALISTDPNTGIVGGINRANWPFWRNLAYKHGVGGFNLSLAAGNKIIPAMLKAFLKLTRNGDRPNGAFCDNHLYEWLWNEILPQQRFAGSETAEAGFRNLKFQGVEIIADGAMNGFCPEYTMFILNSEYLMYRPHTKRNMVPLDVRLSTNQDMSINLLAWAGGMVMNGAQFQGVIRAAA